MTGTEGFYGPPMQAAEMLRERIHRELGFTVNIGVSSNKLLAKIAGGFSKAQSGSQPVSGRNSAKAWPLPVRSLFLVGPATETKLHRLGIETIGDLAHAPVRQLRRILGKQGETIWHFANGRNAEPVRKEPAENKGYGNSITLPRDVTNLETAHQVLLSLCETVGARMRRDRKAEAA